jgi:hypothetical protein
MSSASALFAKLNLKDQRTVVILGAPASFEVELESLADRTILRSTKEVDHIDFAIAFTATQRDVDDLGRSLVAKLRGDAIVWFAYPKKSSKTLRCEFDRDTGWDTLGLLGLERVRQVSIDSDWSALRFRKPEFIKTMVRSFATTELGKKKSAPKV